MLRNPLIHLLLLWDGNLVINALSVYKYYVLKTIVDADTVD